MFSAVADSAVINPDDVALVQSRLYGDSDSVKVRSFEGFPWEVTFSSAADLTASEKLERLGGMWAQATTPYWRDVITYVAEGVVDFKVVDRQVITIDADSGVVSLTSSPVLTEPWTSRLDASDDEQIAEYSHGPKCYVGRNGCECKISQWSDEARSDWEWLMLKQDWLIRKGFKARRVNGVLYVNTVAIYPDGHFKCKAGRCKFEGHTVRARWIGSMKRYVAAIVAHTYCH